jgi:EF hand
MNRYLIGGVTAILLMLGGFFLWQGFSNRSQNALKAAALPSLPMGDDSLEGDAPPGLPEPPGAAPKSKEEKRFNRYDRDKDGIITRVEMMSSRTKAFKTLDKDGNNLLSFEEWAAKTSDKFAGADADKNGRLSRPEFATTAPKPKAKPVCNCND